ncbi:hypothetical protein E2C01_018504 [Portunus trituberculatus]|uniref:Uncharacterized protein n=1 Tax=Portunus trituberculatus TaxID=210409 RepID=A0A5B7DX75_PORTR|nr:hypothetical protein [Portunus trituberculatus]
MALVMSRRDHFSATYLLEGRVRYNLWGLRDRSVGDSSNSSSSSRKIRASLQRGGSGSDIVLRVTSRVAFRKSDPGQVGCWKRRCQSPHLTAPFAPPPRSTAGRKNKLVPDDVFFGRIVV